MFPIFRITTLTVIASLASGCSSIEVGHDFDVRAVEMKIERGVTTQNLVRTWLGSPVSTGVSVDLGGERYDDWTYYFASGKLLGATNAKVKLLQVKFDKQGVVRSYAWSTSEQ